ncbi:MAG TPA: TIGR00725 family protein [Solidesulfovibrio sp.]|jgi:uncharacterized protein (TIGR00725 family)|nr:TIGR00725 family protein [Desulfovibrio sp.]HML62296.1 TIGR00725 family protein [Solidesulfovibrio sp.]
MTATRPRRISVIGAGSCDAATAAVAQRLGTLLAVCGFEVVCGGGGGVMEAVCRGAREAGGRTIGILPGNDREAANPHVEVAIATGMGIARNVLVVVNGDAAVAVAGGAGTLSEIGLALKLGRPVVAFGHYGTLPGVVAAASPEEAAQTVAALLDGS